MLKTKTLLSHFGKDFPRWMATLHQDFVGLMVGPLPEVVQSVLITLDLEYLHKDELARLKPDLILTHHPFIYGSKARVLRHDARKKAYVEWLQSQHIAVYSLHTNFDQGRGGMNDALAEQLGLTHVQPLVGDPLARGGQLTQPMTMDAFARYAKDKLGIDYGFYLAEGKPIVQSIALVGGGGSRSYSIAMQEGYDCFLSGDAPHHVRRSIVNDRYNYVELPHEIERIFLRVMTDYLRRLDKTLTILTPFDPPLPRLIV